jgi:ABC-type spermidine/putrescine transport system permease subunit II
MNMQDFVIEVTRLAVGAFATFCAILLWSRTRDLAWTFVIVGTIVSYAGIVWGTLATFGIVDEAAFALRGLPVVRVALSVLPPLFLGIGFLAAVARRRSS